MIDLTEHTVYETPVIREIDRYQDLVSENPRRLSPELPRSLVVWSTIVLLAVGGAMLAVLMTVPSPYWDDGESMLRHFFKEFVLPWWAYDLWLT